MSGRRVDFNKIRGCTPIIFLEAFGEIGRIIVANFQGDLRNISEVIFYQG